MRRSLLTLLAGLALVAAACGGSGDENPPAPGTTTTASTAATTTTTTTTTDGPATTMPPVERPELSFSVADGWTAVPLGAGVKPVVALDSTDSPAVAWLFEQVGEGFVAYASAADDWNGTAVREGYFYGPIDLAFDPADTPYIAYHDHQADDLDLELGDLTLVFPQDDLWTRDTARDEGHDGWDSTLVIGSDGVFHAAGVDPAQFGSEVGIEYYQKAGDASEVSPIGSGPIPYKFNVGLGLDGSGSPALTYYNADDGDLLYATTDGSSWNHETVASEGNVGKYSSLVFHADGRPAITFFEQLESDSGRIVYAIRDGSTWTLETVGDLASFEEGNARRTSSLAFDSQGRPHVAFSDTSGVWYSIREDQGWVTSQIVTAGIPLGQLVSLQLDASDVAHIAIYEVTDFSPLDGAVAYLTNG